MVAKPNSHFSMRHCLPRDCLMIYYGKYHSVYPGGRRQANKREAIHRLSVIYCLAAQHVFQAASAPPGSWLEMYTLSPTPDSLKWNLHLTKFPVIHNPFKLEQQCYNVSQHRSTIKISKWAVE